MPDYTIKTDKDKVRPTLVPWNIITTAAIVGEFGLTKYPKDSWKQVEPQRYKDAMLRHLLAYLEDPHSVDAESGLLHWEHLCWNVCVLDYFRAVRSTMDAVPKSDVMQGKLKEQDETLEMVKHELQKLRAAEHGK